MKYVIPTYNRYSIEFKKGENSTLICTKGKRYIDLLSGLGVNNLGYSHPKIIKAIEQASQKPLHVSNLFEISSQNKLAELISQNSFKGKAFFANSGAEANEAAIKFLLKRAKIQKIKSPVIFSLTNSFHGRTIGALSATGQKKYQENFSPILNNFVYFNLKDDKKSLEKRFEKYKKQVCGVIVEVIQGEGGVYPMSKKQFSCLQKLCRQYDALLFVDEVQTGCSRTGKFLAHQHYTSKVDGFTMAKSLAGGLPIGCFFIQEKYSDVFQAGDHASTFGGNPFVTTVAVQSVKTLTSSVFLKQVEKRSLELSETLERWKKTFDFIVEIRGIGLMKALEFSPSVSTNEIASYCLSKGVIVNSIGDKILRFLPPLIISTKELNQALAVIEKKLRLLSLFKSNIKLKKEEK